MIKIKNLNQINENIGKINQRNTLKNLNKKKKKTKKQEGIKFKLGFKLNVKYLISIN